MKNLDHIEMVIKVFLESEEEPKLISGAIIGQTRLLSDVANGKLRLTIEQNAQEIVQRVLKDFEYFCPTLTGGQKEKEDAARTDSR